MRLYKSKIFVAMGIVFLLSSSTYLPAVSANEQSTVPSNVGFDKGPSSLPVVATKETTLVNYDENSLLDDYAYLACVPTAVFKHQDQFYSHPLLFYQDEHKYEDDKERSLNARQGLDYFMEDWAGYCNGQLDQMTLINVPRNKLDSSWNAKEYVSINGNNPYDLASDIALQDWSYSDNAVLAVIQEDYKNPEKTTQGKVAGTLPAYEAGHKELTVNLPDIGATGGSPKNFDITDRNYKYLTATLLWSEKTLDYDLQLTDTQLGMLDVSMGDFETTNKEGAKETTASFIHNYGKWKVSITAVPKKGITEENETKNNDALFSDLSLKNEIKTMANAIKNQGVVDLTFYPGINVNIPKTPFGCRDIDLTLKWDNQNVRLGFAVLDPAGAEICSSLSKKEITLDEVETGKNKEEMHMQMLGESGENENYSVCVFSLDDLTMPTKFTLEYNWKQNFSKAEGDGLASASNGAVLASKLNAPLLYVKPSSLPQTTKDVLYKLGVKNIYLVNIGDHLSKNVKNELKEITGVTEYNTARATYDAIKLDTEESESTIVFTTIDPWTYWYATELKPAGEHRGARFVGPAAYIAAHHSSPVVIVDNHPRLSQSITYHTDFWGSPRYHQHIDEACSGNMMISSKQVYEFLEDYNLGRLETKGAEEQIREKIIIVAGQYDIGISWDRALTGAAIQGRFMFSPVDVAYWISRNVFYPALIFENPAVQGENQYINGSKSEVQGLGSWKVTDEKGLLERLLEIGARFKTPKGVNLVITRPSGEEKFEYPVLMTFNTYAYRFNQEASKHWGTTYQRADGIIPAVTDSPDAIDDGAVPGRSGQYYPDISESEVIPFYANKAGYDSVFSTNFKNTAENLNRGVLAWVEECHGWQPNSGLITMWDPDSPYNYEKNPWRAYEPVALYPGNLREFGRYIIYLNSGGQPSKLTNGLINLHLLTKVGSTENPDVAEINTQLTAINKLLVKLKSPIDFWGAFGRMIYRDRVLHPSDTISKGLPFVNWFNGDGKVTISRHSGGVTMSSYTGYDFDDALKNLHSCGLNTISCLPAGTYLHMTWMRHGMSWQIIDPWTTTDWAGAWNQMLVKQFAMGKTVGEAYERGMRACGPEYSVGHFWWDIWENVCYYGDPDLRPFVPSTEYSDANHWDQKDTTPLRYDAELTLNGHMPYGATSYPHEKEPLTFLQQYFVFIIAITAIVILVIVAIYLPEKKK